MRHDLPADIAVFAGEFASQPLVFAHLLDVAPELDLTYVDVIQGSYGTRLRAYFEDAVVRDLEEGATTLVLVLPAAFEGHACPIATTDHLTLRGVYRGRVPHMSALP